MPYFPNTIYSLLRRQRWTDCLISPTQSILYFVHNAGQTALFSNTIYSLLRTQRWTDCLISPTQSTLYFVDNARQTALFLQHNLLSTSYTTLDRLPYFSNTIYSLLRTQRWTDCLISPTQSILYFVHNSGQTALFLQHHIFSTSYTTLDRLPYFSNTIYSLLRTQRWTDCLISPTQSTLYFVDNAGQTALFLQHNLLSTS